MLIAYVTAALLAAPHLRPMPCASVVGVVRVTISTTRWLIVGEPHGTNEAPDAFGDLACAISRRRNVIVAPEQPISEGPAIVALMQTPSRPLSAENASDDVVVVGSRESFKLNTKALRAGQSAFMKNREAFAPRATLRFIVERRDGTPVNGTSIKLYFTDGPDRISVPILSDGSFDLTALPAGEWWLESNLPRKFIRIDALVRSPGSTPYDYRLGDGRLQCRVSWTMLKANVPFLAAPLVGAVEAAGPCTSRKMGLYTTTPRTIKSAEITQGDQVAPVWIGKRRRSYRLAMGDYTFGDEAKVRITMD